MLDHNLSQRVRYWHQQGESIRAIARKLKVARNTVRSYLRSNEHGLNRACASRDFKLDAGDSD